MMQAMKGATRVYHTFRHADNKLLGSMNRNMNLPAIQRIAMEFERENDLMEQRQEMMDDAIDDTFEEEEEESEEIVNQVLDEIGIDLGQSVLIPKYMRADLYQSSAKHLKMYSTILVPSSVCHRPLVPMTICKLGWTV
jgi:division protein CdvB (Snf7/Vps24/ESCRT-III family)